MRRGQILGQVFILILAAAIFILILLYGYRAISQFTTRSEQVSLIDFETEIKAAVKQISLDYGSVKRVDLTLPQKYRQLCVLCTPALAIPSCVLQEQSQFAQQHPLLYESWKGGTQNVFLVPLAETPLLVDRMEAFDPATNEPAFCMPIVQGKVSLRLEGLGDRTRVSPWPTG